MAAVGERVVDEQRHRHLQAALGVWRKRAPGDARVGFLAARHGLDERAVMQPRERGDKIHALHVRVLAQRAVQTAALPLGLGIGDVFRKGLIVVQRAVAVCPVRAKLRVRRRTGIVFDDDAVVDAPPQLRHAVSGLRRGVQKREIKRIPARLAEGYDIRYINIDRHAGIGIRH